MFVNMLTEVFSDFTY